LIPGLIGLCFAVADDKEIFTRITPEDDCNKLFANLVHAQAEIICKGKGDVFRLRPLTFNKTERYVECQSLDSIPKLQPREEILAHFFLGGDKFYFQTYLSPHLNKLQLSMPKEIFQLQRRQNYRLKFPQDSKAQFRVTEINGLRASIACVLLDLSSGGCRFMTPKTPPLKLGDNLQGQLVVGTRDPIAIGGVIRHSRPEAVQTELLTFGIEFTKLPLLIENKLFSLTMDLYREIFKRSERP